MTLRGLSRWSCTLVTGREATWCAMAWENRQRPAAWLWCRFVGIPHCIEQHAHFNRRQSYSEVEPMFPWWPRVSAGRALLRLRHRSLHLAPTLGIGPLASELSRQRGRGSGSVPPY